MYETDKRFPDRDTLKSIADFFNVFTNYLLGRTEFRTPADRISEALGTDMELLEFWEETSGRENLQYFLNKLVTYQTRILSKLSKLSKRSRMKKLTNNT